MMIRSRIQSMDEKFQAEVDANFKAFQGMLPELLARETNRWALMRHGECVGFFDTLRDAHIAGHTMYEDDLFSVQQVMAEVVDLGWFSHAVY